MTEVKWLGFIYLLVIILTLYNETSAVLLTPNKLEYTFFPLNSTTFKFKVRAQHDAHILLTSVPSDKAPSYEIFLGGWRNSRSAIRWNRGRPDKAVANTPGLLSAEEFRGFWVNCSVGPMFGRKEGVVSIGREGELKPFIQWTNRRPFKVQYYGIRTAWGATGEWLLEDPNVFFARVDLYDYHIGQPGVVTVDIIADTQPLLVWKIHNSTISEGNFDETGRYHAAQAFMKVKGEWQAKLFITNVTLEDTEEEFYLTSRIRNQTGANTYHVFLYSFNVTGVTSDDSFTLYETTDDSNSSPADVTTPIGDDSTGVGVTGFTDTSANDISVTVPSNIAIHVTPRASSNPINTLSSTNVPATKLIGSITEQTSIANTTAAMIMSTITTSKSTIAVKTTNSIPQTTTATDVKKFTIATNIPSSSTAKTITKVTNMPNTTTDKTTELLSINKTILTTSMNFIPTKASTPVSYKNTAETTTLCQQLSMYQAYDKKLTTYEIVIGVLVAILVVMLVLVVYGVVKHSSMTGYWRAVKYQVPISMENIYADDSTALIQQLQ